MRTNTTLYRIGHDHGLQGKVQHSTDRHYVAGWATGRRHRRQVLGMTTAEAMRET